MADDTARAYKVKQRFYDQHGARKVVNVTVVAVLFLSIASCHASRAQDADAPSGLRNTQPEDCDLHSLADKEACYARQSEDTIASCEQVRRNTCAPYKQMYELGRVLSAVESEVAALAEKRSAGMDDTNYASDLQTELRESGAAWRRYRDSNCAAEQFVMEVPRGREMGDLAELCRVEATKERIATMRRYKEAVRPSQEDGHAKK